MKCRSRLISFVYLPRWEYKQTAGATQSIVFRRKKHTFSIHIFWRFYSAINFVGNILEEILGNFTYIFRRQYQSSRIRWKHLNKIVTFSVQPDKVSELALCKQLSSIFCSNFKCFDGFCEWANLFIKLEWTQKK